MYRDCELEDRLLVDVDAGISNVPDDRRNKRTLFPYEPALAIRDVKGHDEGDHEQDDEGKEEDEEPEQESCPQTRGSGDGG
jgi:hypothetical protein